MFADASFAAAPFASLGVANVVIDVNLAETVTASETIASQAAFAPSSSENAVAADVALVIASNFSADITEKTQRGKNPYSTCCLCVNQEASVSA